MHATFTSGAARRRDIDAARLQNPEHELTEQDIAGINAEHDREGRINPILDLFRDDGYSGSPDLHDTASEYLFQLARIWSEWQSARIGTFPLEYRDYDGPLDRAESDEDGEDRTYWEITDALSDYQMDQRLRGASTNDTIDRIQDFIVHATAVLTRIHDATKDDA